MKFCTVKTSASKTPWKMPPTYKNFLYKKDKVGSALWSKLEATGINDLATEI